MPKTIEMIGKRFGRLLVIEESGQRIDGQRAWVCRCDCGKITNPIRGHSLRCGDTTSCGCVHKEKTARTFTTHGKSNTRLYNVWSCMKKRCTNESDSRYEHYGGRGIAVCEEWEDDFQAFYDWAMANGYKEGLQIDRIENDGNYCPENCRWADRDTQANNKSDNVKVAYNGSLITITQLSKMCGIKQATLYKRFHKGLRGDSLVKGGEVV